MSFRNNTNYDVFLSMLFCKLESANAFHHRTAVALAVALELNLEETDDLLECAGFALSRSQKFDVIVEYFIVSGKHDLFEINEVLFKYDQPLLGGTEKEYQVVGSTLDKKQAAYMLRKAQEIQEFWFYTLLWIAIIGGFRRGELLALRWSDCDFDKNTIMVDESLYSIRKSLNNGNAKGFKKPKTESSVGKVYMPQEAMNLLLEWKVSQNKLHDDLEGVGDKWDPEWNEIDGLIFTSDFGQAIYPNTITHKFTKFMKDIGLNSYHFHNLRHSTASILFADGKQAKDVQERLRHANVQTTMNIYTEMFESSKERTADDFGKLLTEEIADEVKAEGTLKGTNSSEIDLKAPNNPQLSDKKNKQFQSVH